MSILDCNIFSFCRNRCLNCFKKDAIAYVIYFLMHLQYSLLYTVAATFFGLLVGYVFIKTKNLYYCVGIHYAWNFMESVVFSGKVFSFVVINSMLAGRRMATPDQIGWLAVVVVLIAFVCFFVRYKCWTIK